MNIRELQAWVPGFEGGNRTLSTEYINVLYHNNKWYLINLKNIKDLHVKLAKNTADPACSTFVLLKALLYSLCSNNFTLTEDLKAIYGRYIPYLRTMEEIALTNYYKILQCDMTASAEELRKSYQRLILSSHPDKISTSEDKFLLVQKAWSVLRDSESRKQYDATLMCQEHADHLLYDTIRLSDMDFDADNNVYTYSCRCGGVYLLNVSDSTSSTVVIGCDECSFSIQVNK